MKFFNLQPFVPSGADYEKAKQFFTALGFTILWGDNDYTDFERDGCKFVLQRFDNKPFAENLMITVAIDNAEEFRNHVLQQNLPATFGITVSEVKQQPYGKEVNIIDMAGVCWHFVEH